RALDLNVVFGGELVDFVHVHVNRATTAGGGGLDRAQNPELPGHDRRSALNRDGRDRSTAVGRADGVRSTERRRDVLVVLIRLEQVAEGHVVLAAAVDNGNLRRGVLVLVVTVVFRSSLNHAFGERATQLVTGRL